MSVYCTVSLLVIPTSLSLRMADSINLTLSVAHLSSPSYSICHFNVPKYIPSLRQTFAFWIRFLLVTPTTGPRNLICAISTCRFSASLAFAVNTLKLIY
jgi:hypothetical protein